MPRLEEIRRARPSRCQPEQSPPELNVPDVRHDGSAVSGRRHAPLGPTLRVAFDPADDQRLLSAPFDRNEELQRETRAGVNPVFGNGTWATFTVQDPYVPDPGPPGRVSLGVYQEAPDAPGRGLKDPFGDPAEVSWQLDRRLAC